MKWPPDAVWNMTFREYLHMNEAARAIAARTKGHGTVQPIDRDGIEDFEQYLRDKFGKDI